MRTWITRSYVDEVFGAFTALHYARDPQAYADGRRQLRTVLDGVPPSTKLEHLCEDMWHMYDALEAELRFLVCQCPQCIDYRHRVAHYQELLDGGLSDAKARGTAFGV